MAIQNPEDHLTLPEFTFAEEQTPLIKWMLPTSELEEPPLLVNPLRYKRILKRRIARDRDLPPRNDVMHAHTGTSPATCTLAIESAGQLESSCLGVQKLFRRKR